ncbi:hypothetical protein BO79DRAFT_228901 [Aspergillus costaricaensis CBS 115574]|uniref:Uncharacterized protein n=1 Tax=Aspergillus costaricaensis CBS 115574 TaxID=1448317 RepID=A0ACD1IF28_9EURO|nr:hypothetical protein BO79DRAFT_228901 [Aspergillus costaricaensis CBS 115574]RAK88356.1 hypothetical protein BO79DRAFT_228901 [Aspergillus costaricaensis CBS 115574]
MTWFTGARDTSDKGWHFDAVSLLAVIGESIIERQKHFIVASPFCALPRLLPAPQAILNTGSTTQLPPVTNVSVIGVNSGRTYNQMGYFAGLIHEVEHLEPYEVRAYRIGHTERYYTEAKPGSLEEYHEPARTRIGLQFLCPMNILTLASVLLTIGLAIWSIILHDGVGLLAIITMSISSSLACLSQHSYPELERKEGDANEQGDLVIRTRNGAVIVVHCTEDIAQELYLNPEHYKYTLEPDQTLFKFLMGASTVLLMISVLLLSNCGPRSWDLLGFTVNVYKDRKCANYTYALWNAIRETGEVVWVKEARSLPDWEAWNAWLEEAKPNITNPNWKPEEARLRLMAGASLCQKVSDGQ